MHECLAIPLGIHIDVTLIRVVNEIQRPGPVFNEMARVAYDMGVDYFFRVNDDTEILHPWASSFIHTIQVIGRKRGCDTVAIETGELEIICLTHPSQRLSVLPMGLWDLSVSRGMSAS